MAIPINKKKIIKAVMTLLRFFLFLILLIKNPKRIFSKQDIYDYAWDDIYIGEDKTVNVHISNLRKKLREVSSEEYIETVWGMGFKLL